MTFGIDEKRNLTIQLPVFVQPYIHKQLVLYQIETTPVLIVDQNEQPQSYTQLKKKINHTLQLIQRLIFCYACKNFPRVKELGLNITVKNFSW